MQLNRMHIVLAVVLGFGYVLVTTPFSQAPKTTSYTYYAWSPADIIEVITQLIVGGSHK